MALVGIDFGTMGIRVVEAPGDAGAREVVVSTDVCALPDGLLVADRAQSEAASRPGAVISELKRLIGRMPGDPVAADIARRQGAKLSLTGSRLAVTTSSGATAAVDEAVTAVLSEAVTRMGHVGEGYQAVLAIPEWFEARQEAALAAAALSAGIEVLRFIEDAAAMALALSAQDSHQRTIAVVHLGAGSLGVAFATIDEKSVFLLASLAERRVGGSDVTEALMQVALRDEDVGAAGRAACRRAIEAMQQELIHAQHARRVVRFPMNDRSGDVSRELVIDAEQLDGALLSLREPLADLYEEALEEAALEPDEIDVVYAVGGLTSHPAVADMVLELTEQVPRCEPSLAGLVARGAAIQASILSGGAEGPLVFDGKSTGSLNLAEV